MSYSIKKKSIYDIAGIPSDKLFEKFIKIINSKASLKSKIEKTRFLIDDGYSLSIILQKYYQYIYRNGLFKNGNFPKLISDLSNIENYVAKSTFADIYFAAFIAIILKYT